MYAGTVLIVSTHAQEIHEEVQSHQCFDSGIIDLAYCPQLTKVGQWPHLCLQWHALVGFSQHRKLEYIPLPSVQSCSSRGFVNALSNCITKARALRAMPASSCLHYEHCHAVLSKCAL